MTILKQKIVCQTGLLLYISQTNGTFFLGISDTTHTCSLVVNTFRTLESAKYAASVIAMDVTHTVHDY